MKKRKLISLVLAALLLLSSVSSGLSVAQAADTGTTENKQSAAYFLVKETSDGSWLTKYNWIHFITIGSTKYPAYCVESSRTNPLDGATYEQVGSSTMGYSSTALSGLREIIRNGYPYTSKINGESLNAEQAQAATQMAIRMWLSYRKEQEGASYNVSGMYNPEPKAGNLRIKAGTVSGATDVYNAAIALYKLAKSGSKTTFSVAATSTGSVTFPQNSSNPYFRVQLKVSMVGCSYATISGLPSDVSIVNVSSGTKTQIKNGAVVTLQVPESYAGKTLSFAINGYSNKGNTSLQFYRSSNSPNSYQRLFVPVTMYAVVTVNGATVTTPTHSEGALVIKKTDSSTGEALSGAEFALYVWSESTGKYEVSESYAIKEDPNNEGRYTIYFSANTEVSARIRYTTDNLGKIKVVETKAPSGYSNIDPATGKPYEWERQFTNDGEIHTITIDAENEQLKAYLSLTKLRDDTNEPLSGVSFRISHTADMKSVFETITTNESGYAKSSAINIPADGYVVYVQEVPREGFAGNETIYAVTLQSGQIAVVNSAPIYNTPTKVEISKTDLVSGKELAGATLQILDKDGNPVSVTTADGQSGTSWITTGEVTKIYAQLLAGETYTLKETAAPDGYILASEVKFTVNADGSVTKVTMEDDCTKVLIRKVAK